MHPFNVVDPLTLKLSPLVGAYFVASAIGVLRKKERAAAILRELSASASIGQSGGAMRVFIGGAVLLFHTDFTTIHAGVLTLAAVWMALSGLALLAIPDLLPIKREGSSGTFLNAQYLGAGVGAFLLAAGLVGRANVMLH